MARKRDFGRMSVCSSNNKKTNENKRKYKEDDGLIPRKKRKINNPVLGTDYFNHLEQDDACDQLIHPNLTFIKKIYELKKIIKDKELKLYCFMYVTYIGDGFINSKTIKSLKESLGKLQNQLEATKCKNIDDDYDNVSNEKASIPIDIIDLT